MNVLLTKILATVPSLVSFHLLCKDWRTMVASGILWSFLLPCYAQVSEDIQVSASFAAALELRIDENPSVAWTVQTIDEYQNGFWPIPDAVSFSVSSSTKFRLEYVNSQMQSGTGATLDIQNLAYRFEPANNSVRSGFGNRYKWERAHDGKKGNANNSGIFVASLTPVTFLVPSAQGNAGNFEDNAYKFSIAFGSANVRAITNLPSLLDQNIAPGTYTTTLTLTAFAEP